MKLKDFQLLPTDIPNGVQTILQFGENYELSVIKSDFSYGGDRGLYEIGVFKNDVMIELPGVTNKGDTIKGFLTEADVDVIIKKMHTITGTEPKQI